MNTGRANSDLPAGLTEADLIDLADGVLSREREGVVLAALKQHPEMGLLAKQFRADRSMVAALTEVRAPAGLAEGIEARLTAAALRDLASQSQDAPLPIRISHVQIREPSGLRLLIDSPWTRRLATAASLAIVCGLGALGVRAIYNALPGKAIVQNTPVPNPAPDVAPPSAPITEIATKPTDDTPTAEPIVVAVAPQAKIDDLTPAVAARLAAEGRLTITVRTAAAAPALKRLESLAKARDTAWHPIALEAPAQYAMLLTPRTDPTTPPTTPNTPNPIAITGTQTPSSPTSVKSNPAGAPLLPKLHPVVKAIYAVDLTPGEQPLESLMRSITDTLPEGATVTLHTLPQPIATPVAMDPDSVLWWTSPASKWSKRLRVPVVVEGLE